VLDETTIRILVHRQNIRRYRFLLATPLTEIEHTFVTRRIGEEEAEIRRLSAERRDLAGRPMIHTAIAVPAEAEDRLTSA
jgi:hypothetical protein